MKTTASPLLVASTVHCKPRQAFTPVCGTDYGTPDTRIDTVEDGWTLQSGLSGEKGE